MYQEQVERIELLINSKRFDLAQSQLQQLLVDHVDDSYLYYLLSAVKYNLSLYDEAESLINTSISLYPDAGFYYYFKACIYLAAERFTEVENLLLEAINLEPETAEFKAKMAQFKLLKKDYEVALSFANQALENDAENMLALNMRSSALLKLNRKDEAFSTIEGALREDPEDSFTHANYGWSLLENGNQKKSLEHFREALKYNPNNYSAQNGMVEALKASNILYRGYLKYVFFMEKLSKRGQWIFILGFYFGSKLLRTLGEKFPAVEPFVFPIIVVMALFAFSTWIMTPISNLFFRLNPFAKFLLDKNEMTSSALVGISLLISIFGAIGYLITSNLGFFAVGIFGLLMMIPLNHLFLKTKIKHLPVIITSVLCVVGFVSIFYLFMSNPIYDIFATLFIIIFIGYQFGLNFLMIKKSNI